LRVSDQYGNVSIVDRGTQSLMIANAKRYERFKPGHPSGFIEAFANYYFDTYFQLLAYREGRKIPKNGCDIDVALEGLLFLEAVERSCRSKSWVTM
ncbi:gfo/Idh/MocA family oxidoreductase, partial [bacterium]|nr:gfo/Idh/MocA family oxidoreductase [bacterium]